MAAHHAKAGDVHNHDDGKGHQTHHHVIHAHISVGEDHAQRHRAVGLAVCVGGHAGVLAAVCERDASDVKDAVIQKPPFTICRKRHKNHLTKT